MPIITECRISGYSNNNEPVLEPVEKCICPKCQKGILKIRGHVSRHSRQIQRDGTSIKQWFRIPYGQCSNKSCRRMFRMLSPEMVPFKHYDKEAITDVLDGVITPESGVENPSVLTMLRWIRWLSENASLIEGILRSVGYRILGYSEELLFSCESLLEQLRQDTDEWLPVILRAVYNSGHRLRAC